MKRTTLLVVGDPNQKVYDFAGASRTAMDTLKSHFGMTTMPLSMSFRCSKAVVKFVNELFPQIDITAFDQNAEGRVDQDYAFSQFMAEVRTGDWVVCRNIAPQISPCYQLIKKGVKAQILGDNQWYGECLRKLYGYGKGLAKDNPGCTLYDVFDYTGAKLQQQLEAASANPSQAYRADLLHDQVGILSELESMATEMKFTSLQQLSDFLDQTFPLTKTPRTDYVNFMTIHRSKGGESKTVFVLQSIPNSRTLTPEQKQEEENLKFVAYTRSAGRLVLVEEEPNRVQYGEEQEPEEAY
jgi:superfamily I DNA/RNA helicase